LRTALTIASRCLIQPHPGAALRGFDWPQLIIDRDITLADGQRYYTYPDDLAFDDIGTSG
jgi:hypothetical protein